jgi:hypothetical protein
MGDPVIFVVGNQTYDLSYRISPPVFRDNFSLNIIEKEWDAPLNNITFSIVFPKPLDSSTVRVFTGPSGIPSLSQKCFSEFWVDTLTGRCNTLA